jgi:hypothetical protein
MYEQLFDLGVDSEQVFVVQSLGKRTGVRKRETP